MPTISRFVAAIFFAATGYLGGEAFKLGMPEGVKYGLYSIINLVIGLLCGWIVMGSLTGRGYGKAAGSGLRTSVTITVWALLVFSILLMVRKAFMKRYGDSPMAAIADIFALALEHALLLLRVEVLAVLVMGGILGGLCAEWVKQRWE